ncbi:hypothetical protein ACF07B_13815 [Streptomyces sp. NPDC015532]|uniref:hypothetical protein n=1 Tax=Streptomyces sp. NPDC015532 TaxID=3364960 RepID=UPI0036FDD78E
MISDKLHNQTNGFTKEIQTLRNGTIASHVQIKAVALQRGDDRLFLLGHLLDKKTLTAERFPLKPRAPKAALWMDVSFQLRLDAEPEHLMVHKSFVGAFGSKDGYEKLLEAGREQFRKNQLMAAMRRDPATVDKFIEQYGRPSGPRPQRDAPRTGPLPSGGVVVSAEVALLRGPRSVGSDLGAFVFGADVGERESDAATVVVVDFPGVALCLEDANAGAGQRAQFDDFFGAPSPELGHLYWYRAE